MTQKPKKIDYTTSDQQLLFNAVNAINGFTFIFGLTQLIKISRVLISLFRIF